jgi:hypothetical protein
VLLSPTSFSERFGAGARPVHPILGHLQFSTPVTFGATAPAHGVGFRLADTANHEVLSRLAPAG